jgi:hypothetical protein
MPNSNGAWHNSLVLFFPNAFAAPVALIKADSPAGFYV